MAGFYTFAACLYLPNTFSHQNVCMFTNWSGRLAHRMATSLQPSGLYVHLAKIGRLGARIPSLSAGVAVSNML